MNRLQSILLLVGTLFMPRASHAAESKPISVFVTSACDGPVGSLAVALLKDAIRFSAGYHLASNLMDDEGYGAVVTLKVECAEETLPSLQHVASIAFVLGFGACKDSTNCAVSPNEHTLKAFFCSDQGGPACGRDLYNALDSYMIRDGGYLFHMYSDNVRSDAQKTSP